MINKPDVTAVVIEADIVSLDYPDNIRKRPGMYIGSVDSPDVITREPVDNSLDEALAGFASQVTIETDNNTYFTFVADDGRGLPVYEAVKEKGNEVDKLEISRFAFAKTHVGSKFGNENGEFSLGLNGVGTSATNALSEHFLVIVNLAKKTEENMAPWIRDEFVKQGKKDLYYYMSYSRGIFQKSGVAKLPEIYVDYEEALGFNVPASVLEFNFSTLTIFKPDNKIFETLKSSYSPRELKLAKMLHPHLNVMHNGKSVEPFEVRTDSFIKTTMLDDKVFEFTFEMPINPTIDGVLIKDIHKLRFQVYIGYSQDDFSNKFDGSVNLLDTVEGVHINNMVANFTKVLSQKAKILSPGDCDKGLRLFVLCMSTVPPDYIGQTKEKLGGIKGYKRNDSYDYVLAEVNKLVKTNPEYFNALVERLIEYKKLSGNLAIKDLIERSVIMGDDKRSQGLGKAIKDCSTRDREQATLFIVEGDSAGGTVIDARDGRFQAVLALRGKTLNASSDSVDIEAALNNPEIKSMINSIGVGIDPYVDLTKRRYGRICILTDADTDGSHIANLILFAFAKFLPQVIEDGMLYIAQAPIASEVVKGLGHDLYYKTMEAMNYRNTIVNINNGRDNKVKINKDGTFMIELPAEGIETASINAIKIVDDKVLKVESPELKSINNAEFGDIKLNPIEFDEAVAVASISGSVTGKLSEYRSGKIKYFKGLGSADPEDLEYCVTDPKTASWIQVQGDTIQQVLELGRSSLRKKNLMKEIGIMSQDL